MNVRGGADRRRGEWAFGLTVTAFVWATGLVFAAFLVPVYGGTETPSIVGAAGASTLVGENGLGVLVPLVFPAAVTALVWLALRRKCSRGSRRSGYVAWGLVGLLAAFCVVAMFSIGVFVLPVGLLLARAITLTPSASA